MGSPTMSTQSPQTGGKSSQLGQLGQQGLAGGKGTAGGVGQAMQGQNTVPTTDMMTNFQHGTQNQQTPTDFVAQQIQQPDNSGMMSQPMMPQRPLPMPEFNGQRDYGMGQPLPQVLPEQNPQAGSTQDMLGSGVGQTQSTSPQQSAGGKGMAGPAMNAATSGMGQGNVTYPSQSGQPVMGMPNAYSNTVGQPNTAMTPTNSGAGMPGGKGSQQSGKMGR